MQRKGQPLHPEEITVEREGKHNACTAVDNREKKKRRRKKKEII